MFTEASPELILDAYRQGIFPMAESAQSLFFNFYRPEMRGQLSLTQLHVPKRLRKTVRQAPYTIKVNTAFADIIDMCAEENKARETTWINKPIRNVFIEMHALGHAHSVECWDGMTLVGGLYGMALGRVFCGESMVSHATDASKIALVHLCARLWKGGFSILDTQFTNAHLEQFGVYEIPQEEYEVMIETEMLEKADFSLKKEYPGIQEGRLVDEYLNFLTQD